MVIKKVVWVNGFETTFKKIKDKVTKERKRITKQIEKIITNPHIGKPLSYSHKGERRVRIGSYRLTYAVEGETLYLLRFEHRGGVYN